ncbi:hypothetical protein [Streptomyces coelicoflavus]|uniref:hypothetical protein n=1 Tax=Streptomyces coelicoflavus TaxID=285562 RepID=UPI0036312FE3
MSKPLPNVCEEPEPVRRAWVKIREELGINVLHHDRQRVFDIVAHELAELLREQCDCGEVGTCRCPCADLIDPEAQR